MEIQICEYGILAADYLVLSRYIMERLGEKYNVKIDFRSKPVKGDWNGSGCHTNFSTKDSRNDGGYDYLLKYIENLDKNHKKDITLYGEDNNERLTGLHETSTIDKFTYGIGSRNTSIRIPLNTFNNKKGYIEDRRPSSSCDPYIVTSTLLNTCCNIAFFNFKF